MTLHSSPRLEEQCRHCLQPLSSSSLPPRTLSPDAKSEGGEGMPGLRDLGWPPKLALAVAPPLMTNISLSLFNSLTCYIDNTINSIAGELT
jgi:hypothetical protein